MEGIYRSEQDNLFFCWALRPGSQVSIYSGVAPAEVFFISEHIS